MTDSLFEDEKPLQSSCCFFVYKDQFIDSEYTLYTDNPDYEVRKFKYKVRYRKKPKKTDKGLIYLGTSITKANAIKEFANNYPDKIKPLCEQK